MEMNNLSRVESHVAQKNRRHKLRFQQNSGGDHFNHHHQQPPPPQDHHHPSPFSYNPNVFPSEMMISVARNPHLLLPPSFAASHDHHQDSCMSSGSGSGVGCSQPERMLTSTSSNNNNNSGTTNYAIFPYQQQDCSNNNWKTIVNNNNNNNDYWNVVSNSNVVNSMNSTYGFYHDNNIVPFYNHNNNNNNINNNNQQVTLAQYPQTTKNNNNDYNNNDHVYKDQTTSATQGLSLSLSSVVQLKEDDHHHQQPMLQPGQKSTKSDHLPNPDPKSINMGGGVYVSGLGHSNIGPLGPFTGYATVLKNSKYMKPAQQVLNKCCDVGFQELVQTCLGVYPQKILEEEMSWASDYCSVSNSFNGLDEYVNFNGRSSSGRPEFHRKKAKLLYMQEEICRRYKQYLQQMQMVISSFETVAGLSEATPYVCLALKAVSGHFHYVKDVISEQLSQMKKMVEDGLCSSTTTSGKAFDANVTSSSKLKSVDQQIVKYRGGGGGAAGFFTAPQPVWRPQRGLPERAISVLKTWLFDHFLHPYPSDTDKHMLATQTGLTRNQVSNWFINARVRIWKPMVEEIHTLETQGSTNPNLDNPQPDSQDPSRMDISSSLPNTQPAAECSRNPGVNSTLHEQNDQLRDHEKQASNRPDQYQIPISSMDRLMSIMPYPRATFDATGLGPVSLTLGLRQNAEHVQQLQQHFGGHQLIHDFVG